MKTESKHELSIRIVSSLVGALSDRKGFNMWWESIDKDVSLDIIDELVEKTKELL